MAQPIDIQIERSLTNTPISLLYGEPAWDDTNEKLYVGNSSGTPVLINPDLIAVDNYTFPAGRNSNISSDQALRRQNNVFTNVSPYLVPYDSEIYAVGAINRNLNITRTWDFVVEVNGSVIITLSIPNNNYKNSQDGLSIAVNQNDEIAIYFRNASAAISRPCGAVYGRRI